MWWHSTGSEFGEGTNSIGIIIPKNYLFPNFFINKSCSVGWPISCNSYRTRCDGLLILMMRVRSIGVPMMTRSTSDLLIVSSRSFVCASPYPIAGRIGPVFGYFSYVAAMDLTANGRGSTISAAPKRRAAT